MHVDLRLLLSPESDPPAAAEPGRRALSDAIASLFLPWPGHVHLDIEGHRYVVTGCERIEHGEPVRESELICDVVESEARRSRQM